MIVVPVKEGENIERALKSSKENLKKPVLLKNYEKDRLLQNHPLSAERLLKRLFIFRICKERKNSNFLEFAFLSQCCINFAKTEKIFRKMDVSG